VGKIYQEFQESVHVQEVKYNPAWPNYIAFDWGFTNPLAAIEFQVTPWQQVRIWREHYKGGYMLSQHLNMLRNREQPDGYKIDLTFGDAASPESVLEVSTSFAPCYADPRSKSGTAKVTHESMGRHSQQSGWREGVELVKSFLQMRQIGEADEFGTPLEIPGLLVDHSCANTIREFNNYRAPSSAGRVLRNVREDAQKYDDHALDAIRYALMHIFKLGATARLGDLYSKDDLRKAADATFVDATSGWFSRDELSF
jgi:hypothetical protein